MHELEQPRLLVLGNYPFSPYKVGDVIKVDEDEQVLLCDVPVYSPEIENLIVYKPLDKIKSDFLNLFRLLEWWEYRKREEMPKFVKHKINPSQVRLVLKYIDGFGATMISEANMTYNNLLPATETEYNEYVEKLNK